ncbi:MAG TPA: hypothetical protein VFW96_16590 [Thermomicrobiales bacterium]|nr:hypothetical protein [Thermomicrobiales bacterium]
MVGQSEELPVVAPEDLPEFATEDDEAEYWSQHDSSALMPCGEDVSDAPPAELRVGPGRAGTRARARPEGRRMKLVSLYLPDELIAGMKRLAGERHIAYQALMRSWISERLALEDAWARVLRIQPPSAGAEPLLRQILATQRAQLAAVEGLARALGERADTPEGAEPEARPETTREARRKTRAR